MTTNTDNRACPFTAIAALCKGLDSPRYASAAKALAVAFATAHQPSDVYAVCRAARHMCGIADLGCWLDGGVFAPFWSDSADMSHDELNTVRELAHAYLETV